MCKQLIFVSNIFKLVLALQNKKKSGIIHISHDRQTVIEFLLLRIFIKVWSDEEINKKELSHSK